MHLDLPIKLKLVWFLIMTSKHKMRQQIFEIVHKRFSTLYVNVQTMKKKKQLVYFLVLKIVIILS